MKKSTIDVSARQLKKIVGSFLSSSSVKRLVIRDGNKVVIDVPLYVVGVGSFLAPFLAGLSAMVVLFKQYQVDVYHDS